MKDDESHPIPNSQLHQPPITPYSHFPFLRFSLQTLSIFIPTFPENLKYPRNLPKKKKKKHKTLICFSLSFFSLQTRPNHPLPLFVSEDNPNSLAGKKNLGFFFFRQKNGDPRKQHQLALRLWIDGRYPCSRCEFLCS